MKRIIVLALCILLLCACSPRDSVLAYQDGELLAECKINGEYTVNIIKKEDFRALEIVSPSELSGISFVGENGSWTAKCDDVEIPLDEDKLSGICALTSIFDLSESAITTTYDKGALGVVSFEMERATYTVTYNELSLPKHIKIASDELNYDIEVLAISKAN